MVSTTTTPTNESVKTADSGLQNLKISLGELITYHGMNVFDDPHDLGLIDENTGTYDLLKIEQLFDDYVQDKIEEKHGKGWEMYSASGGVVINFEYDVDEVIYEDD
tara:strand:+ start:50 stop:367 length:318 start_codon:yes stop_codon:yes gene_type:complete